MLYLGCEGTNSCFQINSWCWRDKQLLSKGIPMLKVQTQLLSNQPLCWRCKQLLSKRIPTLEV